MTDVPRDPRRGFTRFQRFQIWVHACGRCEDCGRGLSDEWDAHHKKHHAKGGRTEILNGRALCEDCHKREHAVSIDDEIAKFGSFRKDYGWQEESIGTLGSMHLT
jgi:5-methylcytosine-specific restriction endonuclease McrA